MVYLPLYANLFIALTKWLAQYLIMNLGMSTNFGPVSLDNILFPVHMRVDWIRVYQPEGKTNVGCDPKDFPTQAYIKQFEEAYASAFFFRFLNSYEILTDQWAFICRS